MPTRLLNIQGTSLSMLSLHHLMEAVMQEKITESLLRLLRTNEAANYLSVSEHWLKASRFRPELAGPPFVKIGRVVRYDVHDLEEWIADRKFRGTHEIPTLRGEGST